MNSSTFVGCETVTGDEQEGKPSVGVVIKHCSSSCSAFLILAYVSFCASRELVYIRLTNVMSLSLEVN